MSVRESQRSAFGRVLRDWRTTRGLSQLELALNGDVSQRHISFLESGRAQPSRDMVLQLATVLDIPLREQNIMLEAAGFAHVFKARELSDPQIEQVRKALEHMLQSQPYPSVVIDRHWNLQMGNAASTHLMNWLMEPNMMSDELTPNGQMNVLRLLFHPDGIRPFVGNWREVAGALIERLHREAVADGQREATMSFLDELLAYPDVPRDWFAPNWEAWTAPILTLNLAKDGLELNFFSTITTLGTPRDITLQELHIEHFFPADTITERNFRILAGEEHESL